MEGEIYKIQNVLYKYISCFYAFNRIILANHLQRADVEVRYCLQFLKTCHLFFIVSISSSFSLLRTIIETGWFLIHVFNCLCNISVLAILVLCILLVVSTYQIQYLRDIQFKIWNNETFLNGFLVEILLYVTW